MKINKQGLLVSTAMIAAFTMAGTANAQLEDEIIVTAQKRTSTLQDTPIAMSAVSSATLDKTQIRDAQDLQVLVPSFSLPQFANPSASTFTVRGIGTSGFNAGLEPSVGVFIDGVYRSRAGSAINDFIAVERIEVLRGPQSTLYGKNTPAGVLSIITKKPQFELGYEADFTVGNYDLQIFKGSVTGPISDNIAFRLSGNTHTRDGYFTNDFDGRDLNDRNRYGLRADFLIEPSDVVTVRIIADYNNLQEECCSATPIFHAAGPTAALTNGFPVVPEIIFPAAPLPPFVSTTSFIPLTSALPGGPATLLTRDPFDRHINVNGQVFTNNVNKGLSAEMNFDFDGMELTTISAYRSFVEESDIDADFINADIVSKRNVNDDFNTFTQEIRLTSTGDNTVDWMVGGYYYNQDLNTRNRTTVGDDARTYVNNLTGLLSYNNNPAAGDLSNPTFLVDLENLFLLAQSFNIPTGLGQFPVDPADPLGPAGFDPDNLFLGPVAQGDFFRSGTGLGFNFNQKSESYSFFGSADWHVNDQLTITGGLRWTNEDKDVTGVFTTDDVFSSIDLNNLHFLTVLTAGTVPVNAFAGFAALQPFKATADFTDTRSENKVTGNFIANYEFNDEWTFYGSYSRGYKAGGFNLSQATSVTGRDFEEETMDAFELGWKSRLFDNRVRFSGAVFMQTLTDFQSNTFNGVAFDLSNAGSVSIDGVEWDITAQPIDDFIFTFAGTYLDAKYDEFLTGPSISGSASPTVDLSGERLAGVSEFVISSTGTYSRQLNNTYEGYLRGEAIYRSHFAPGTDLNPLKEQDGSIVLSASVGISNEDDGWDLSVWGKNINSEEYFQGVFDTVFQPGSLSGYPISPPTYGVTLRIKR
ncbi:MAG: TonB-dependent receptor [Robiginitomaculum sp.]|nr:TonB-dependent receptor [Robiginitomaculum sp.]